MRLKDLHVSIVFTAFLLHELEVVQDLLELEVVQDLLMKQIYHYNYDCKAIKHLIRRKKNVE